MQSMPAVHRGAAIRERNRTAPTDERHTGAMHAALIASPFPKDMSPLFLLSLSAFVYQPDIAKLRDLMRLIACPRVPVTIFPSFLKRTQEHTGSPGNQGALLTSQPCLQIS